ncbi:hypothetical protein SAV14893_038740 [Streptomyces avermitilis]|uniref:Uncharacterized protein n=1 Tax=Streptomyces avermitilis TaxID=33903 RepID=A0A4D4LSC9_STRAX|nr:hypothetical protein SAVMC3_50730 [Streptomyces avermitilis]GDY64481.1 hypothetical protein SAV14893_038740 [Streptomyces avermitilis]
MTGGRVRAVRGADPRGPPDARGPAAAYPDEQPEVAPLPFGFRGLPRRAALAGQGSRGSAVGVQRGQHVADDPEGLVRLVEAVDDQGERLAGLRQVGVQLGAPEVDGIVRGPQGARCDAEAEQEVAQDVRGGAVPGQYGDGHRVLGWNGPRRGRPDGVGVVGVLAEQRIAEGHGPAEHGRLAAAGGSGQQEHSLRAGEEDGEFAVEAFAAAEVPAGVGLLRAAAGPVEPDVDVLGGRGDLAARGPHQLPSGPVAGIGQAGGQHGLAAAVDDAPQPVPAPLGVAP